MQENLPLRAFLIREESCKDEVVTLSAEELAPMLIHMSDPIFTEGSPSKSFWHYSIMHHPSLRAPAICRGISLTPLFLPCLCRCVRCVSRIFVQLFPILNSCLRSVSEIKHFSTGTQRQNLLGFRRRSQCGSLTLQIIRSLHPELSPQPSVVMLFRRLRARSRRMI